jgi:DNA-binding transcriptional LysR family regulator
MGDFAALLTYVGRVGRGEAGHLRVAFLPSATNRLLPAIVRAFRSDFPSVTLALEERLDDPAIEGLLARRFDVALIRTVRSRPELRFESLVREPLCVAVGHDHRLARRRRVRYVDLRDEGLIIWPRRSAPESFDEIVERCRGAGFTPRIAQEVEHAPTILGLVSAGVGISVLARSYEALRSGDVVFVPLERHSTTLHAAWRTDDQSAARENFVATARRVGPAARTS